MAMIWALKKGLTALAITAAVLLPFALLSKPSAAAPRNVCGPMFVVLGKPGHQNGLTIREVYNDAEWGKYVDTLVEHKELSSECIGVVITAAETVKRYPRTLIPEIAVTVQNELARKLKDGK